jgi:hypothetical protein
MYETEFLSVRSGIQVHYQFYEAFFEKAVTNQDEEVADQDLFHEGVCFAHIPKGATRKQFWDTVDQYFLGVIRKKKLEEI